MKKIISNIAVAFALIGAFSACDNEFEQVEEIHQAQLQITAGIEETRAANIGDRAFYAKDSIGIFVVGSDNSYSHNLRGDFDGSSWQIAPSVKLSDRNYQVNAYYPYDNSLNDKAKEEYEGVSQNSFTMSAGTNHMVANATASSTSPMANLTFRHVMARVSLEISGQKGNLLKYVTFSGDNVYGTATYSFYENRIENPKASVVTIQNQGTEALEVQTLDALLIPTSSGETTINMYFADEKMYSTTVVLPVLNQNGFYRIPVNLIDTNGHDYVDLGLPSGTLWATCNVGASMPQENGGYYAWGETETKDNYDWASYKWCDGASNKINKYCTNSSFGKVDNKSVLDLEDDAAHVNWGGDWRMPTRAELDELCSSKNCTWTWTTMEGQEGYKVASKSNGKFIFLPAGGSRFYTGTDWITYYASSSLDSSYPLSVCYLTMYSGNYYTDSRHDRIYGQSIRPVIRK